MVEGPVSFDLIAVTGIEEVLGSGALGPGEYTQVRLTITETTITVDGDQVEATVPSETLRIVRPFTIVAGETTIATLDFDAEESVVRQGNGGILIRPVIKLLVRQEGEPFEPDDTTDDGETPTPGPDDAVTQTPGAPGGSTPTTVPAGAPVPTDEPTETPIPTATQDPLGEFFLVVEEPAETDSIITESSIAVVGRTRLDAAVSVNDVFAIVDAEGRFSVDVDLEEGPNIIEVVASLETGEQFDQILVVIYSP